MRKSILYGALLAMLSFTPLTFAQEHTTHVDESGTPTRAVGVWLPTEPGQCTKEMHDRYAFTDPDTGETFTVPHAFTDSTGCSYGHDHASQFVTHIPTVIPDPITNSMAMGLWKPSADTLMHPNECTQEEHDSYKWPVEGKYYPIWHPPVHIRAAAVEATDDSPAIPEQFCFMGHEHGDNPELSPIYDRMNPIVMGYVNEKMLSGEIMMPRHEDHVGHKFAVVTQSFGFAGSTEQITCHTVEKFHQGTHSPDAFTNNLHEVVKMMQCPGGFNVRVQAMAAVGKAGWIEQNGSSTTDIFIGTPTPPDSPIVSNPHIGGDSLGDRDLPTSTSVYVSRPNFFEQWRFQVCFMAIGEKSCAFRTADYWGVSDPSRFPNLTTTPVTLARPVDACWLKEADESWLIDFGACLLVRKHNITNYRDIRSPFNGAERSLRQDNIEWRNVTPVFYTDPLGMRSSVEPVPGVSEIKQEVSVGSYLIPGTTRARVYVTRAPGGGVNISSEDQRGVHAPN